jgi:hypothetical protein
MDIRTCSFNFLKLFTPNIHDKFYKLVGISREQVWIQRSSPGSSAPALGIISIETEDPANTMKEFAASNHPWAQFREYAKKAFGIDLLGAPSTLNEIIVDWYEK